LIAKFKDDVSPVLSASKIDEAIDALINLERYLSIRKVGKLVSR